MSSVHISLGTTTRLTPADEGASIKSTEENRLRQAFQEWPNDAGFDGLTEHRGPVELKVKGTIPVWAAGSLYRTGPGQCKVDDTKSGTFHISHWFDGLAHTHRFDIVAKDSQESDAGEGGQKAIQVFYSSRRQSDKLAADIKAKGALRSITFGQRLDPCVGIFGKLMSIFTKQTDLYNVNVTAGVNLPSFKQRAQQVPPQGHRVENVILGTDAAFMCEVDPSTMETISFQKQSRFHPRLEGPLGGAHGKRDPQTGDYINYNLDLGKQPTYRVFQVSAATGKTAILATIPYKPAFVHSFFLTQDHVILCVPVAHYEWNGAKMLWEGNLKDAFKPFDPSEMCRWFVIDRHHGKGVVAELESPGRFFFHTVNAFEDEEYIFCDVVEYPNRYIIDGFYYDVLLNRNEKATEFRRDGQTKEKCVPQLARYRLCKKEFCAKTSTTIPFPKVIMGVPSPHIGEMPIINPHYLCRKHRFNYFLVSRVLSTLADGIGKLDMETREVLRWEGPHGHTPGEAIFVPRPGAEGEELEEDDGVLLSVVLDGTNRTSYLLCLDARTMVALGVAECEFGVPIGLHGRHVPVHDIGQRNRE